MKTLGLGTVQFGIPYGVTNAEGRTSLDEVRLILNYCQKINVSVFDTAANYGQGEEILGSLIPPSVDIRIVTKSGNTSHIRSREDAYDCLRQSLVQSLIKLKLKKVYGFLLHKTEDFLSNQGDYLFEALHRLQDEGLVEKIGASVYHPGQAEALLHRFTFDLIQLPTSILDQRFLLSGVLDRLKASHVEIHARSIFLQGILLSPTDKLPPFLSPMIPTLIRLHSFLGKWGMTPLEASIDFIKKVPAIDVALVGVNNLEQFKGIADVFHSKKNKVAINEYESFGLTDLTLVDPSRWPKKAA